ncbi:MAG: tRNA lysidine(34) synthetase TilS [Alphaproteobacteria bacterium]|nr:tRNA lysidine(34) synthetase TilS [Alphaproteobacteria bacterium]
MSSLSHFEFKQLMNRFTPFDSPPVIAVATSGGPDSLALTLLAHQWAQDQDGKAIALTVDHQLRKESTEEAYKVKGWMKEKKIDHYVLTWQRGPEGKIPETALQAKAREARYHLLGQWCKDHGIKHLLTGHHSQDQLETFMIRLAKGSGLKGLTGIQDEISTPFGRILRPLLTIDSQSLKETLHEFGQPFIEDPSNNNQDFARIRWRKLLPILAEEGLSPKSLQETLERLRHSQRLIDQYISSCLQHHVTFSPYGYIILKKTVTKESGEVFEEILKRVFTLMGTKNYPVRRQALHRAMAALTAEKSITLAGCQILNKTNEWWIIREPAAVGPQIFVESPGTYHWDDRFIIEIHKNIPCRIDTLSNGLQLLDEKSKEQLRHIPSLILQTLPALWQGENLVVPLPSFTFSPFADDFLKC